MIEPSFNYVRTFRLRHALSEAELAHLIGYRAQSAVAQVESGTRVPSLAATLALQAIFKVAPHRLFPGLYEHVEDAVMRRAAAMLATLEGLTDSRSVAKRKLLESLPHQEVNDAGI